MLWSVWSALACLSGTDKHLLGGRQLGRLRIGLLLGSRVRGGRLLVSLSYVSQWDGLSIPIVVVLGGDTPYGLPLILDLERKGYIVIASVSTPEAIEGLESRSKGYVKALVLNPSEVRPRS